MSGSYTKPFVEYYDIKAERLIQRAGQELEFFKFVFGSFAKTSVNRILDVGCGTMRNLG